MKKLLIIVLSLVSMNASAYLISGNIESAVKPDSIDIRLFRYDLQKYIEIRKVVVDKVGNFIFEGENISPNWYEIGKRRLFIHNDLKAVINPNITQNYVLNSNYPGESNYLTMRYQLGYPQKSEYLENYKVALQSYKSKVTQLLDELRSKKEISESFYAYEKFSSECLYYIDVFDNKDVFGRVAIQDIERVLFLINRQPVYTNNYYRLINSYTTNTYGGFNDSVNIQDHVINLSNSLEKLNVEYILLRELQRINVSGDPTLINFTKTLNEVASNFITHPEYKRYSEQYYSEYIYKTEGFALVASNMLYKIDDSTLTLSEAISNLKGKVIVLDFWATWCGPCIAEFPAAKDIQNKIGSKDLAIVTLSIDEDVNKWKSYIAQHEDYFHETYLIKYQPNSELFKYFSLDRGIPQFVLIDKKGVIRQFNADRPSSKAFRNSIARLLSE